MYNQFILEELKTLNDLLNTGAITQGEYDHLKQILIDGTKAGAEAPLETKGVENQTPEDAVKHYINEAKTFLLYNQYDKSYSFLQKALTLRPDHREAMRLKREVKSHFQKDYFVGAAIGVVFALGLSYLLTIEKDVNVLLLCILPLAAGLLLPILANSVFSGRASRPVLRYFASGSLVLLVGLTTNIVLSNGLLELERSLVGDHTAPVAYVDSTLNRIPAREEVASLKSDSSEDEEYPTSATAADTEAAATSPNTKPNKSEILPSVGEDDLTATKQAAIKDILKQYYRDYNHQKFDAAKYFAPKVDRFINLKNTTPAEINSEIENGFYEEFQEAMSSIDMNTLNISKLPKGYYQADFEETMSCFRKSKEQHQFIRTKVKVIFDKDLKIRYSHQERILESKFGLKAANEFNQKIVYTNQ